jgi:two-component system nitrogen regulation sensor histidine kinase GlnL
MRGAEPPPRDSVFDSLSTAVIIVDGNLLIEALNPAAENLLGISATRARRQSLLQIIGHDDNLQDILPRVLTSGVTYACEMRLAPTEVDDNERLVDCRVSLMQRDGQPDALLVEMSDVTRRNRISRENALLSQHGAGRQMIRQLAHEIKNPLGGLRGAAQLLERQLDSQELKEYTDVIISEADRLAALVDTLLGPGGPPNKQRLNIHELLEYVLRLVESDLGDHIEVRRDYDAGLPDMDLDRDQMVQALLNLVQNAAAALEGRGLITLRTRAIMNFTIGEHRHPVVASIEIEDDGPGIPPPLQDSIFYPLVTSKAEGHGLGLPAAQELISRHGGLIEFESRPGRTVFQVRIPLTSQDSARG